MRRIGLVGAGYISRVHAEALGAVPGTRITAIIDPVAGAAHKLAQVAREVAVFTTLTEALAADAFDCAHVLVPPPLHAAIGRELIAAGKAMFMEKPLAASDADCAMFVSAAANGASIGVNQNFVYHPAFARLRRLIESRVLGRPRFIDLIYNVPLRQLAARQFNHWMFEAPGNILLEQAVHPLSQLCALAGPIIDVRAVASSPMLLGSGQPFHASAQALLTCERLPAQLRFAVGQSFPFWQVQVVCDDGIATADILANRCTTYARTRWMDAVDFLLSGTRTAAGLLRDSIGGMAGYSASMLKLRPRSDPFFLSMRASIAAFHAALDANAPPPIDAAFGQMLVRTCEHIRDAAFTVAAPAVARMAPPATSPDITILGGTGFIGTCLVRRCLAENRNVAVMARSVRGLPAEFADPRVQLMRGDIRDPKAVADAIAGARVVVNLAHGGGGGSWEEIRAAMVGGAETVARATLAAGTRRLVHVGSIASLYLGPQRAAVTGATPPDPRSARRADYARAKAECDRMLLAMQRDSALPVVILRPGVVVGDGTSPFHSGLGLFNNEQHCIGWNAGRNPLPFVLVEDVADAILRSCDVNGIDGACYNLVGDVRWTAREYIAALATALERPLRFHPNSPTRLWLLECGKWSIKRATGRPVPFPSRHDFLSRGMTATFDCSDARDALGWRPVSDPAVFRARAIEVHARGP
jgi:predicted dehydrogenase/nucleoside-diphosphate-sugar epimerase